MIDLKKALTWWRQRSAPYNVHIHCDHKNKVVVKLNYAPWKITIYDFKKFINLTQKKIEKGSPITSKEEISSEYLKSINPYKLTAPQAVKAINDLDEKGFHECQARSITLNGKNIFVIVCGGNISAVKIKVLNEKAFLKEVRRVIPVPKLSTPLHLAPDNRKY